MVDFPGPNPAERGGAKRVHVSLEDRSYDIVIGEGELQHTGALLTQCRNAKHAIVVTDSHVESPHAEVVVASLADAGLDVGVAVLPPGEETKSIEYAEQLWNSMLEMKADRRTVVVAVGGGVIGDLAGFVAATFTRGIDFLQVPTTLLAQVDSSVGGKVGINLPEAKNMVGSFWQPLRVVIDPLTLQTLPDREYRSALAEVVKYGVILDLAFFEFLEQHVAEILDRESLAVSQIIARSCELKARVVEADERELTGGRAVLNYGHTFGHALEATLGYGTLLHGEAVSVGMQCAARLAVRLGRFSDAQAQRQERLLDAFGLPLVATSFDPAVVLARMRHDKKVAEGQLKFVLPSRLGHVETVGDVPEELVREALLG